jgi:uncharacterized tellurite resistance protein B-like protein
MTTPLYDNIAPLIADLQTQRRSVTVEFVCPRSGDKVTGRHTSPASSGALVKSRLGQSVKRSMMWSLRSTVASLIRGVFGHNFLGRMASDLVRGAMNEAQRATSQGGQPSLSDEEEREAVVEAFRTVQSRFVWDPSQRAWISARAAADLMSPFQRQLAEHPLTHPYDRQVLARMLVEIARADGKVETEEQTWLTDLLSADQAGLTELARRPPLTASELGATSAGEVRASLLISAWALALVDEHFDEREQTRLQAWSEGLDLRPRQITKIREAAQSFVLDQALERMQNWGGLDAHARDQLYELAARIGMSRKEAEAAEAAFQRRYAT